LESAVSSFKPLQRVEYLQTGFLHLLCALRELICVPNCEPDPVHRHTRLVRQFKLHRRRPRLPIRIFHRRASHHDFLGTLKACLIQIAEEHGCFFLITLSYTSQARCGYL
jgi:hypothetical protein